MTSFLFFLCVALTTLWLLLSRFLHTGITALDDISAHLATQKGPLDFPDSLQPVSRWADRNNFLRDATFVFAHHGEEHFFCRVWHNVEICTSLVFYNQPGRPVLEFSTLFDDKTSISTTNSSQGHALPSPPGAFVQSFPVKALSALFQEHAKACTTMTKRTGLLPRTSEQSTQNLLITTLHRQASYIRSIPGWQWKAPWWFLLRQKRMNGKTVAWQLEHIFGVTDPDQPQKKA